MSFKDDGTAGKSALDRELENIHISFFPPSFFA